MEPHIVKNQFLLIHLQDLQANILLNIMYHFQLMASNDAYIESKVF